MWGSGCGSDRLTRRYGMADFVLSSTRVLPQGAAKGFAALAFGGAMGVWECYYGLSEFVVIGPLRRKSA